MVAAVCQFEDVQSAVDATVNVLQSCIPVAKIGEKNSSFACLVEYFRFHILGKLSGKKSFFFVQLQSFWMRCILVAHAA